MLTTLAYWIPWQLRGESKVGDSDWVPVSKPRWPIESWFCEDKFSNVKKTGYDHSSTKGVVAVKISIERATNHSWFIARRPRKTVNSLTTVSFSFQALCISWWEAPPQGRATKNYSIDSFTCSPPRKSLVKGERFVRVEGKPELPITHSIWHFVQIDPLMHMGHNINSPQQPRMRLHTVNVPIRRHPGIEALHYLLAPCNRSHDQLRRKC